MELTSVGPTPGTESIRLVLHLESRNLHACGVVPLHLPALGAHVAGAEEVDGAVALAHYDSVVDASVPAAACWLASGHGRVASVESDVEPR